MQWYDGIRRLQEITCDYTATAAWEPSSPSSVTHTLSREYVWGPGDGVAGVDELLAQYGPDPSLSAGTASNLEAVRSAPWWTIQDGGGDVVAVGCHKPAVRTSGSIGM